MAQAKKDEKGLVAQATSQEVAPKEAAIDNIMNNMELSDRMLFVPEVYKHTWITAQQISQGDTIPTHYKDKPANVFMALVRSARLKVDVYWFMEQSYIVGGKLAFQGKLVAAIINSSGLLKGRLHFDVKGEGKETRCTCWGILKSDGERVEHTVSYAMAEKNGWTKTVPKYEWKNKEKIQVGTTPSKWDLITTEMCMYRSASLLGNTQFSDITGGLTEREYSDVANDEDVVDFPEREPVIADMPPEPAVPAKTEETKAPAQVEVAPESETEPPLEGVELIEAEIGKAGIAREAFNSYLVSRKCLVEGEDMISMKEPTIEKISSKIKDAISDYKVWVRKIEHDAKQKGNE